MGELSLESLALAMTFWRTPVCRHKCVGSRARSIDCHQCLAEELHRIVKAAAEQMREQAAAKIDALAKDADAGLNSHATILIVAWLTDAADKVRALPLHKPEAEGGDEDG